MALADDKLRDLVKHGDTAKAVELSLGEHPPGDRGGGEDDVVALQTLNKSMLEQTDMATRGRTQCDSVRTMLISAIVASILFRGWRRRLDRLFRLAMALRKAVSLAEAVALGDLSQNIAVSSNDEIKDLVTALTRMTVNLRMTAELADAIAGGDLTVTAKPLSDKDTLGHRPCPHAGPSCARWLRGAWWRSDNVSSGSQQLSASAEQLSQGATEQAVFGRGRVGLDASEMAANIKQNAENATPDREDRAPVRHRRADGWRGGRRVR